MRAVDRSKDQSYVLFGVPRGQLAKMMLPVGGFEKPAVREMARKFGLPTFDKADSQEICFVPDNDYAGLVERRRDVVRTGKIVDREGRELGTHGGQHRFTVGQRKGLGVSADRPLYVLEKRAACNTVVVGDREGLMATGCVAGESNWLVEAPPGEWVGCEAKVRYNAQPVGAEVRVIKEKAAPRGPTPSGRTERFEVRFDEPQAAVAPGQAVVVYQGAEVMGGGWIERAT